MSKETDMLRKFASLCNENDIPSFVNLHGLRDRVAFAIEAVEAQVAEAVARVAALEKRTVAQIPQERPACTGEDAGTARGGTGAAARSVPNAEGSPAGSTSPPASSAVTAPRGFRVGDRVIVAGHGDLRGRTGVVSMVGSDKYPSCRGQYQVSMDEIQPNGPRPCVWSWINGNDLFHAPATPEAPAEDAGLVERLARIIVDTPCAANHEGQCIPPGAPVDDCDRANARAVLSDLTAESRLCAPGEVARLKDELAEANGARFLNANAVRLQKARAEAAEKELAEARAISAATAERVRNETQIATELRKDLADANGARDRLVRELSGERVERDYWKTRAEDVTKERDALRADLAALKAKPRFRTRAVTAADVRALDDEWAKSKYVGRDSWSRAMNAVGLRRRVEQSK